MNYRAVFGMIDLGDTTFASRLVIKKQFLIVAPRPEIQLLAVTGFTRRYEDDCENSKLSATNKCMVQV